MKTHHSHRLSCPDCQGPVSRVQRRLIDRLAGLFVPVLRYQCTAARCGWEGLLRRPSRGTRQRLDTSSYMPRQVLDAPQGAALRPRAP